jgi:hypothetical protein
VSTDSSFFSGNPSPTELDNLDALVAQAEADAAAAAASAAAAAATLANALTKANNLSDVADVPTSRTNLGLGTAAVLNATGILQPANNLSDLVTPATARTNLGLGSSATHPSTDFLLAANNLSDVTAATARTNLGLGSAATHPSTDFAASGANSDITSLTGVSARYTGNIGYARNIQINGTVASNNLTVTLLGADGNALSAANPAWIPFRDSTIANGTITWLQLTSNLTIGATSGNHLGTANNTPFRFWLVAVNNAGTPVLGLINCVAGGATPTSIYPLRAASTGVVTTTTSGVTAQSFLTPGGALTSKAFTILGYLEWGSGLATAGTYASGPTKIELFGPGVPAPGEPVGNTAWLSNGNGSSTTSTSFVDVANSSLSITPLSAVSLVRVHYAWAGQVAAGGAATNTSYSGQLLRGATVIWGPGIIGVTSGSGTNMQTNAGLAALCMDNPFSTSAQTYKLQNKTSNAAGAAQTFFISAIAEEIMV